jgi:hypothetical protein
MRGCGMPVNMTGYPSDCKPAHHAPTAAELEFAMHSSALTNA